MNAGPGDPRDPMSGAQSHSGGADEEPTLETGPVAGLTADEEPTLETNMGGGSEDPTTEAPAPGREGWASRIEKMAASEKERRRRVLSRIGLAAIPVVLLLLIAVILLSVYGGLGGDGALDVTTTTLPLPAAEGSALLIVEQGSTLAVAIILQPWDEGGVVFAVPGIALFDNNGEFQTLDEIYQTDERDLVKAVLSAELDLSLGPVATVEWSELQMAMKAAMVAEAPNGALTYDLGEAVLLAQAARAFVGEYASDLGLTAWVELRMAGEAAELRGAVSLDATSMVADVWTVDALKGDIEEGDGFLYLEPDLAEAKELLGALAESPVVSVLVEDGAGVPGAASQAGDLLEAAGYGLLPMTYAEDFPGVETTRIMVSAEMMDEARRVRLALGLGEVVEDPTVDAHSVVVILGKDFGSSPEDATQGTDQG